VLLLAETNLAVYYNEPFWLRFLVHSAFFGGSLYMAARLQADGLVRRASWRYWQVACLCLCLWNLAGVATLILRESVDVGTLTDEHGEPLKGEMQSVELRGEGEGEKTTWFFYSLTGKHDPMYEGARFSPISSKGEIYYYLQFDIVLLVLAGVFALLGLHDERSGRRKPEDEGEGAPDA